MKIQEVFDHLSYGEFSQLNLGGAGQGVIDEANYSRVINHIQLGLTALYKRFNLKERRTTFELLKDSDTYTLDSDDLLKVERVIVESGVELSMNDFAADYGCFTPSLNTLRFSPLFLAQGPDTPEALKSSTVTVAYRANHPKIIGTSCAVIPEISTIELPPSHLEALLYFVASRAHNPIGMSNEFHAGNTWYAKYEAECRALENSGYRVQESERDLRFHDRGWV
jgi:hypothetical protein